MSLEPLVHATMSVVGAGGTGAHGHGRQARQRGGGGGPSLDPGPKPRRVCAPRLQERRGGDARRRRDLARRAGQVTVVLACGATEAWRAAPELAVDCLLRRAADAAADAAGVGEGRGDLRGAVAGLLVLRCDGRVLRDGGATLAEAGVTSGSRLEVLRAQQGGMQASMRALQIGGGEFQSMTRSDLMALIGDAEALLRKGGHTGPVTSHAVQGLFRNERKDADGKVLGGAYPRDVVAAPFHPQERWPGRYSRLRAVIVVTYTWRLDLVKELPAFLDEAERKLGLTGGDRERATWWLDVFFNSQNATDMGGELERAKRGYQGAQYHVVLLRHGVFKRGWCLAELLYRLQVPPPRPVPASPRGSNPNRMRPGCAVPQPLSRLTKRWSGCACGGRLGTMADGGCVAGPAGAGGGPGGPGEADRSRGPAGLPARHRAGPLRPRVRPLLQPGRLQRLRDVQGVGWRHYSQGHRRELRQGGVRPHHRCLRRSGGR
jgi:hypothetical protein